MISREVRAVREGFPPMTAPSGVEAVEEAEVEKLTRYRLLIRRISTSS